MCTAECPALYPGSSMFYGSRGLRDGEHFWSFGIYHRILPKNKNSKNFLQVCSVEPHPIGPARLPPKYTCFWSMQFPALLWCVFVFRYWASHFPTVARVVSESMHDYHAYHWGFLLCLRGKLWVWYCWSCLIVFNFGLKCIGNMEKSNTSKYQNNRFSITYCW